MRECNIFSLFTLRGGYPISGLGRGVPYPRSRWGTPFQVWGGTPISGLGRGVPRVPPIRSGWGSTQGTPRTWDGVPPTWDGVPSPDLRWGTPLTWDGVPPWPEMGYPPTWDGVPPLSRYPPPLHSSIASTCYVAGRCASCVHAGGLSCFLDIIENFFGKRVWILSPQTSKS